MLAASPLTQFTQGTSQIKHQTETITQLKAEVQQWKAQLARIEETSRQEVESWKEQYRRTEHERARLSVRLEEMLAGQYAVRAQPLTFMDFSLNRPCVVECCRARVYCPLHPSYDVRRHGRSLHILRWDEASIDHPLPPGRHSARAQSPTSRRGR